MEALELQKMGITTSNKAEILNQSNLNWNIRTEPLVTQSGLVTDNIAIVRDDTNTILGIHKEGYKPVSNSELLDLVMGLAQTTQAELHKGGYLKSGEYPFFQLKTNDLKLGNDLVKGYATGINSFNGKLALGLGQSSVTISCMNTLHMAFKQLEFKVKHTKNMQSKIDLLAKQFDQVIKEEKQTFDNIKKLSEVQIDPKLRELVLSRFLQLDKEEKLGDLSTLSTRKKNIFGDLWANISHQTAEKGENLWGLLSGFTRYTTHAIKGNEMENKIIGIYGKREIDVYQTLVNAIS